MELNHIYQGDCHAVMQSFPDNSVDALVCDPPAGIAFMNKSFDSSRGGRTLWIAWLSEIMQEALRVMKPGAHGFVWALPRTSHWTMCALEDAGFEIRDVVHHIRSDNMPKGTNIGKAIDKRLGAQRETIRTSVPKGGKHLMVTPTTNPRPWVEKAAALGYHEHAGNIPVTPEAEQWDGWNTALKPSVEYWILVRKPLAEKTIVQQVLKTGTGALNIDACRVPADAEDDGVARARKTGVKDIVGNFGFHHEGAEMHNAPGGAGRWPAHLVLSHGETCTDALCEDGCPVGVLNEQSGVRTSGKSDGFEGPYKADVYGKYAQNMIRPETIYGDTGGASRYFTTLPYAIPSLHYMPKASPSDRTMQGQVENHHPTAKSTKLMEWLVKLITPPGGVVFDPFCGSGSTLIAAQRLGFQWIGIDEDAAYIEIARARLATMTKEEHRIDIA